jgi:hypothetical protein
MCANVEGKGAWHQLDSNMCQYDIQASQACKESSSLFLT